MKKTLAVIALTLLPSLVFAAGFAKQSLFLSQSPVTEGDTVRIFAVVSNGAATKFTGSVVFKDGDTKIGSTAASIDAGGAQTVSVSWKPAAGLHSVVAELTASNNTVVESESATFNINAKPKPVDTALNTGPTDNSAAVESSQGIQNQIGSVSPQAEGFAAPLFSALDTFRSSAADTLNSQLANAKKNLAGTPQTGIVAGASTTSDAQVQNPWGMGLSILWTFYLYVLTVLLYIINNPGVFYPVIAIAFLYILWRAYRRFRRPY